MWLSRLSNDRVRLISDGEFDILGQCTVRENKRIFTFLEDIKYIDEVYNNTNITCVICKEEHLDLFDKEKMGIMIVDQPRYSFFQIHNDIVLYERKLMQKFETQIGQNCIISPTAIIDRHNVVIGSNVVIEDYVVIHADVTIGDNTIVRTGSVIGGQGFEFKRDADQRILRVEHAGKTIIGEDIEIKEGCTIHRALFSWDYTLIGNGSKLDAHSHVGHATKVGENVMVGSHANLAGNIVVQDNVNIGPGATLSNRITIGANSKISIGSVVTKDVEESCAVTGNFAIDHKLFIKNLKQQLDM